MIIRVKFEHWTSFCQSVALKERTSSQILKPLWLERSPICPGVSLLNQARRSCWSTAFAIILLINVKQLCPAATLSIFSGSRCLHEVTKVDGERDRFQQSIKTHQSSHLIFRFVAVFCFSTKAGVKNSAKVNNGCKSNWSNHFSLFPSFFLLKVHQLAHTFLLFLCRCRKCSGAVSLISDYWFVSLATYTATIL